MERVKQLKRPETDVKIENRKKNHEKKNQLKKPIGKKENKVKNE